MGPISHIGPILFSGRHDAQRIHFLFRQADCAKLVAVAAQRLQGVQPHAAQNLLDLVTPGAHQVDQPLRADLRVEALGQLGVVGGDTPGAFAGVAALAEGAPHGQQGGGPHVDGIGAQGNGLDGIAG